MPKSASCSSGHLLAALAKIGGEAGLAERHCPVLLCLKSGQKAFDFCEPQEVDVSWMNLEAQNRGARVVQVKAHVKCADGEYFENWTHQPISDRQREQLKWQF
jgi:hypothetical protein